MVNSVTCKHASSGISVLTAPFRPEYAENVTGEQFAKVLKYLSRMYAYVIVDTSSALTDITLSTIDASDMVVLVTSQDIPSIKNCRLFLDLLDALGIDRNRVVFVMNHFDKRIGITPERISENFKHEISAVIPFDEKIVVPSVNRGVPLILGDKSKPVAKAILSMAEALRKRIAEVSV